jgi:hypothetical protein
VKPIILSKDELRAALNGTLTEVWRKVKPQPVGNQRVVEGLAHYTVGMNPADDGAVWYVADGVHPGVEVRPYPTGTRLWVKETWQDYCPMWDGAWCGHGTQEGIEREHVVVYFADPPGKLIPKYWKTPTTMPSWASRLTLTVESVAVSNDGGTWWWVYGVALERKDAR